MAGTDAVMYEAGTFFKLIDAMLASPDPRFLNRLNLDVRQQIYRELFASTKVRLTKAPPKTTPPEHNSSHDIHYRRVLMGARKNDNKKKKLGALSQVRWDSSLHAILLVNKKIYYEAVSVMYESITFDFVRSQNTRAFLHHCSGRTDPLLLSVRRIEFSQHVQISKWVIWHPNQSESYGSMLRNINSIVLFMPWIQTVTIGAHTSYAEFLLDQLLLLRHAPQASLFRQIQARPWVLVEPVRHFRSLRHLRVFRIQIPSLPNGLTRYGVLDLHHRYALNSLKSALERSIESYMVDDPFQKGIEYLQKLTIFAKWKREGTDTHPSSHGL